VSLLPDTFDGPPDKMADVMLDFFGPGESGDGDGKGGAVEPAADADGVLIDVRSDEHAVADESPPPEHAGAAEAP
jgi:hypothetical protein